MTGWSLSSVLVVADLRLRPDLRSQPEDKHRSMAGWEREHRREKANRQMHGLDVGSLAGPLPQWAGRGCLPM